MIVKRNGVILTVLFALSVTIGSISYTFYQFYRASQAKHIDTLFTKYSLVSQIYHTFLLKQTSLPIFETNLAMHELYIVNDASMYHNVTHYGKVLKKERSLEINTKFEPSLQSPVYQRLMANQMEGRMINHKGKIYFWIRSPHNPILIEDRSLKPYRGMNIIYAYLTILAILFLSFGLILYRLFPLRRLRKQIAKFGEGDMNISFDVGGSDEISLVARELETARIKIRSLIDSRTLFLRNIMHELKTLIAKGRIAASMLDDEKQHKRFEGIFGRLEGLIQEFALIEQISSGTNSMEQKSVYRLIDILDGAMDMAMVDTESVEIEMHGSVMIEGNFQLIETAIKNMIDNGLKYSDNGRLKIIVSESDIAFVNPGKELSKPLEYYLEPFTKENAKKDSFGLGLYIVKAILDEHGIKLGYERRQNENWFFFHLQECLNTKGKSQ